MKNTKQTLISWLQDIRFWIILFFLIRMIGITNAPLEIAHNWRQTTVTMAARNFLEVDNNILYPRIDFAGEKTGITGMEFPFLNYLIYLVSLIFGYQHWYGRLINLIFSSFGIYCFYLMVKTYFSPKVAFNSSIVLLVSIWFSLSRKIMPDTFSVSIMFAGLYFGLNSFYKHNKLSWIWNILLYAVLTCIAVLSKLPAGYLLVLFAIPLFSVQIKWKQKIGFMLASILALIPSAWWYFYWVPHLVEEYGFWHFFMGKGIVQGMQEIAQNLPQTLSRFYDSAIKFTGFAAFLFGLGYGIYKKEKLLLAVFLLSFLSFLVIIFKAGITFPAHNYYIAPFVPIMALVAGYGLSQLKNARLVVFLLVVISLEGILNQQHEFFLREQEKALLYLEADLDQISERGDLIFMNSGHVPTPMYFAHRKGWIGFNQEIQQKAFLSDLQSKSLKYIVILKRTFGTDLVLDLPVVLDNLNYRVYDASKTDSPTVAIPKAE